MKWYHGLRTDQGCLVTSEGDGGDRVLPLRLDLDNHSPTGFEWGYAGSGPAQLALALLADASGDDELAISLHQKFKFDFVARLPRDSQWSTTDAMIINWLERSK
jgi:Family of unknown function (DUF6166)